MSRTDRGGRSPTELRRLLSTTRQRGYASEDGEVTQGFASLLTVIRVSVSVTWDGERDKSTDDVLSAVLRKAEEISHRLSRPAMTVSPRPVRKLPPDPVQ